MTTYGDILHHITTYDDILYIIVAISCGNKKNNKKNTFTSTKKHHFALLLHTQYGSQTPLHTGGRPCVETLYQARKMKGSNYKATCNVCLRTFASLGASKARAHLAGAKGCGIALCQGPGFNENGDPESTRQIERS